MFERFYFNYTPSSSPTLSSFASPRDDPKHPVPILLLHLNRINQNSSPRPIERQRCALYILSTGVNPNNRIPFPNTCRAASYSPISARFFSSLSAYMTLIVLAFLFAVSLAS